MVSREFTFAILGCFQSILRIQTIRDFGLIRFVVIWVLFVSVQTVCQLYSSVKSSESRIAKRRKLLYISGFCDTIAAFSYAMVMSGISHVVCIVQTPIVSHSIVAISHGKSTSRFPLQILGFMLCSTGLLASCWSESDESFWLIIVTTFAESVSLKLKSHFVSQIDGDFGVHRFNTEIGVSSVVTCLVCIGAIAWLRPSNLPIGRVLHDRSASDFILPIIWAMILALMFQMATSLKQSKYAPLTSFLVCSFGVFLFSPTLRWDITFLCGQFSLLCGTVVLCVPESLAYGGHRSQRSLLSRTTE